MKSFFIKSSNVLDKRLIELIESQSFTKKRGGVNILIGRFLKFYAKHFTNGNIKKAEEALMN